MKHNKASHTTTKGQIIATDHYGADVEFCKKLGRIYGFIVTKIFRYKSEYDLAKTYDFSQSGLIVTNHSNGFWGIIDVLLALHLWYNVFKREDALAFMSDERVFRVPIIGFFVRRIGFKVSSIHALRRCLADGHWAVIVPGGNTDQLRSIWHRNETRMYKTCYLNGKFYQKEQTWFVHAAATLGVKTYPIACAGLHEVTPILWESKAILKYTGLIKLRAGEFWPGFPVSLNHFINLTIFYWTGWMDSILAWALFLVTNIYIDLFYSYPIFFPRVRLKPAEPITLKYSSDSLSLKQRKRENLQMLAAVNQAVNHELLALNEERPIVKHLPYAAPIAQQQQPA